MYYIELTVENLHNMKKIINFRVWHNEFNRFLSKDEWVLTLDGQLKFLVYSCGNNDNSSDITYDVIDDNIYVIQQYIGIKDKNGNNVYEGDIIRQSIKNRSAEFQSKLLWEVKFFADISCFGIVTGNCFQTFEDIFTDDDVNWEIEVIGNIFENHDVLVYKK